MIVWHKVKLVHFWSHALANQFNTAHAWCWFYEEHKLIGFVPGYTQLRCLVVYNLSVKYCPVVVSVFNLPLSVFVLAFLFLFYWAVHVKHSNDALFFSLSVRLDLRNLNFVLHVRAKAVSHVPNSETPSVSVELQPVSLFKYSDSLNDVGMVFQTVLLLCRIGSWGITDPLNTGICVEYVERLWALFFSIIFKVEAVCYERDDLCSVNVIHYPLVEFFMLLAVYLNLDYSLIFAYCFCKENPVIVATN